MTTFKAYRELLLALLFAASFVLAHLASGFFEQFGHWFGMAFGVVTVWVLAEWCWNILNGTMIGRLRSRRRREPDLNQIA